MASFSNEEMVLLQKAYLRAVSRAREMNMRLPPDQIADRIMTAMTNGERELDKLDEIALLPHTMLPFAEDVSRLKFG